MTETPTHTITLEVDVSKLFDAVASVGDGGVGVGTRIVGLLLSSGEASFAEALGLGVYGISVLAPNSTDSHHRLVEALEEARTELSITRTNIMCEINRCADPRDSRWEGVPEILKERIAKIDAAIKEAGR